MKSLSRIILTYGIIGICVLGGYRVVASINFSRYCSDYLKNAADANTIEQAEKRLAIAVQYIKDKKLDHGFTSVLWTSPSEDVAFWAENLKGSLEELQSISVDATSLEKSNVLMKLRETILDSGGTSQEVTAPTGISVFPNNIQLARLAAVLLAMILCGTIGVKLSGEDGRWQPARYQRQRTQRWIELSASILIFILSLAFLWWW